jgi:thiosulfate/3-mercaptopyruvate sulfurtransferase
MSILSMAVLLAAVSAPLDGAVVPPAWLQQHLEDPAVIVVEVGENADADGAHIPGARFLAIETILDKGFPTDELPPVEQLTKAFEQAGIGDEGRIILYSREPLLATRAWFTLDAIGQGSRASILDGGTRRWIAEGRPTTKARPAIQPVTFSAFPTKSRVVTLDEVRTAVASGAVLLDARSDFAFRGITRGDDVTRRGHIPNAICTPWQNNVNASGWFLPLEQLKETYARLIPDPDTRVIVYCRTGVEATMPYFVLRSLGYDVALYDGSFVEWSKDPGTPVTRSTEIR